MSELMDALDQLRWWHAYPAGFVVSLLFYRFRNMTGALAPTPAPYARGTWLNITSSDGRLVVRLRWSLIVLSAAIWPVDVVFRIALWIDRMLASPLRRRFFMYVDKRLQKHGGFFRRDEDAD